MTTAITPVPDAAAFSRTTAALLSADSEHLPRVLDVAALGEHRELVLQPVGGPTLGALLAHRRRIPPGEAVTVVIGAVRAVAALHDAGYCGVQLGPDDVRFDIEARPVLVGVGAVRENIQAGAAGSSVDWRAVGALADLLGLIAHGRAGGALGPAQVGLGLALATVAGQESEQALERLEDALFDLAEPVAVQLGAAADPAGAGSRPAPAPRRRASHRLPSGSRVIEAFEAGPSVLLAAPRARLRELVAAGVGRMTGRVKLLAIGGATAVVLTVAAVAMLPNAADTASAVSHQGGASRAVAARVGQTSARTDPAAASPAPTQTVGTDAALTQADPVAAATALLAARDACLGRAGTARQSCFDAVGDGTASALDQPDRPLAGLTPSLLERDGATALIALTPTDAKTNPASALLMRTEAGWKLRQLYEN